MFLQTRNIFVNRVDMAEEQKWSCVSVVAGKRTLARSRALRFVSAMEPLAVMRICLWSVTVHMDASLLLAKSGNAESSYSPFPAANRHR